MTITFLEWLFYYCFEREMNKKTIFVYLSESVLGGKLISRLERYSFNT